jgi:hypothetical protein
MGFCKGAARTAMAAWTVLPAMAELKAASPKRAPLESAIRGH